MLLLDAQMSFYLYFEHPFSDLCEIRYESSAYAAIQHLWVSWKSAQGRPYIYYGHKWNHIYTGTVKPYEILEVESALVKSVHHVIEYTFCSLVMCSLLNDAVNNSDFIKH